MIPSNSLAHQRFSFFEYSCITDIADIWDSILPVNHSLVSPNLKVLELAKPDDMQFKYLMVRKMDAVIGVIYLQQLKITTNHFDGTAIDKPGLGWLKKCINSQFRDVLICGNLFRVHFPGYYFKNTKDDSLVFEILTDYLNSTKENKRFCGILVKDSPHQFKDLDKFKPYHDDVTMEIEIKNQWKSMDDYKFSLRKKYRQRYNTIQNSGKSVTFKEFSLDEIIMNASQIEQLYLNVALKQSLRIGFVNAAYFIEMKRCYGDSFILKGYYFNNELVAFSSHIMYENEVMEIHFIGLNYNHNDSQSLYFNILFDGLEIAILKKMKRLELGRTARVAKASLGGKPIGIFNYILLKKGIPSLAFTFFNTWFVKSLGEDWMQRNPFK